MSEIKLGLQAGDWGMGKPLKPITPPLRADFLKVVYINWAHLKNFEQE